MSRFWIEDGQMVSADGTRRPATGEESAMYAELQRMSAALGEVAVCGSGFLQGRCDADCVARTMTQIVAEYRQGTETHQPETGHGSRPNRHVSAQR